MYALPCGAHGKDVAVRFLVFLVCFWHTAMDRSPVVTKLSSPRWVACLRNHETPSLVVFY